MKIHKLNNWYIVLAAVAAWFPVFSVPFVNDDFQMLIFHKTGNISSLFSPFWQPDISVYYWRPLGNMLHPLMLLLFGFNPLPFRILSFFLYLICCITLAKFLERAGLDKKYAVLGGIIFAILPSHQYQVAWIADQGESLVTILLLLTFIFYERNLFIAALCYLGALLTKESAFTGIFIPFIYLLLSKNEKKLNRYIRDALAAFLILVLVQLYRYYVPGGSALSSSNFEGTNPLKWIINFFLYVPLAVISPEMLDSISSSIPLLLFVLSIGLATLFFIIRLYRKLPIREKRIFEAGILWFIIFILPALPKLMRWYVFTASAGLILSISVLMKNHSLEKSAAYLKPVMVLLVIAFLLFSLITDISTMYNWKISGEKMKSIVSALKVYKTADTLALFCVPEKINNVPLMKLGIKETVEYGTGKKMWIYAPLRCELFSTQSNIVTRKDNDSSYTFTLSFGRFKSREGKASSYIKKENFSFTEDGYKIEIKNGINGSPVSEANVYIPYRLRANLNLFYNGNNFIAF